MDRILAERSGAVYRREITHSSNYLAAGFVHSLSSKHSKVVAHRLFLSTIAVSVIGSFVYDLIKLMKP